MIMGSRVRTRLLTHFHLFPLLKILSLAVMSLGKWVADLGKWVADLGKWVAGYELSMHAIGTGMASTAMAMPNFDKNLLNLAFRI